MLIITRILLSPRYKQKPTVPLPRLRTNNPWLGSDRRRYCLAIACVTQIVTRVTVNHSHKQTCYNAKNRHDDQTTQVFWTLDVVIVTQKITMSVFRPGTFHVMSRILECISPHVTIIPHTSVSYTHLTLPTKA